MSGVSSVWVGCDDREFARLARAVRSQSDASFVNELRVARSCSAPSFVFLAQSRPGIFDASDVGDLRELWPQSRFLYLLGEWCCGEKRTSREFVHVPAVYTHQIDEPVSLSQLIALSRRPGESMPSSTAFTRSPLAERTLVAIYSPSRSFQNGLADAMAQLSMKTVELRFDVPARTTGVDFVIWDASECQNTGEDELRQLRIRHPQSQIIALLTYPREFERRTLVAEGIRVLAQPFAVRDLVQLLATRADLSVTSAA